MEDASRRTRQSGPAPRAVSSSRASLIIATPQSAQPFPSASTSTAPALPTPILTSAERLPINAGPSRRPRAWSGHSRDQQLDSALSTSPHAHFPSPLAKLYHHPEADNIVGLRRRQSLGVTSSRPGVQQQGPTALEVRLEALVARLEKQLAKVG